MAVSAGGRFAKVLKYMDIYFSIQISFTRFLADSATATPCCAAVSQKRSRLRHPIQSLSGADRIAGQILTFGFAGVWR